MADKQFSLYEPALSLLLLAAFYAISRPAFSQTWVPFVGVQRQTLYKLSAAGKQLVSESEGAFMRNSNGSIYSRNTPVFGLPPGAQFPAHLQDARTGVTYILNYAQKSATPMFAGAGSSPLHAPSKPPVPADATPLGQKTIAGVKCIGYRLTNSPGLTVEIWFAPSLNYLAMAVHNTFPSENVERDADMISIDPGKQPDPQYFRLPGDPRAR